MELTKKQRFKAIRNLQPPDFMPVWPRVSSQMIYGMGWRLPDVTGPNWYDSDKCTEAVLWSIRNIGYDVALPSYMDIAFGVPAVGGDIVISNEFGSSIGIDSSKPVQTKNDWAKIQKKLAHPPGKNSDARMKGALQTINNVSLSLGETTPLVATCYSAATLALLLFRPAEEFLNDMANDPKWVDEMCQVTHAFSLDWIRAQYEAGANSVTFVVDTLGLLLIGPQFAERYTLPYLAEIVQMVKREFNQGVWLHIHGNMKTPVGYAFLGKIVSETGIEGFQLDEPHPSEWIRKNVVEHFGIPACLVADCYKIARGPAENIHRMVKSMLAAAGQSPGFMMAPCCQVLPYTSNEHFKAWVDATHEFGRYPTGPINLDSSSENVKRNS